MIHPPRRAANCSPPPRPGRARQRRCGRKLRVAQAVKLRVGYWPVAAGLPFFAAVEKGYFKEAGVEVEPIKFAGAQQ